eukprot:53473-Amphidinium_carterae.3
MALKRCYSTVLTLDAQIMHVVLTQRWSAVDGKVRCRSCAPLNHRGPLIRFRGSSFVSLTSSSPEPENSCSKEERVIEKNIRSQDFIGMINFTGRDVDSFHLVDQDSSRSLSSEESEVQGRDLSQPEITRVQVRAHQRTLHDGRVVNVKSHSRSNVKEGQSPSHPRESHITRVDSSVKEKEGQASKERESLDLSVQSVQRMSK